LLALVLMIFGTAVLLGRGGEESEPMLAATQMNARSTL
jgi:hypothetical protein